MNILSFFKHHISKVTQTLQKKYRKWKDGPHQTQRKKKMLMESFEKNLHTLTKEYNKNKGNQKWMISLSTKTIVSFWLIGWLVYYLWYVAFAWLHIIYLILTWLIIAIAMESVIRFRNNWMKRWLAIALAYVCLMIFVLLWLVIIIPFTIHQIKDLLDLILSQVHIFQANLATYGLEYMIEEIGRIPDFMKSTIITSIQDGNVLVKIQEWLQKNVAEIVSFGTDYATRLSEMLISFFWGFINFLIETLIVFTVAILCSIEKDSIVRFLANMWWPARKDIRTYKIETLYKKLGAWLQGQFLLCIIIGVAVRISLSIASRFGLHIPNISSLALIAGLTEFVPYIWPILWAIPALLIATTTHGMLWFLVVGGIFILIQRIENDILIPWIMKKTLGVSAIVIFISMLIGWVALGFLWVLLAVPLAVIVTLLFDDTFE